jgi:hypothetical protein
MGLAIDAKPLLSEHSRFAGMPAKFLQGDVKTGSVIADLRGFHPVCLAKDCHG